MHPSCRHVFFAAAFLSSHTASRSRWTSSARCLAASFFASQASRCAFATSTQPLNGWKCGKTVASTGLANLANFPRYLSRSRSIVAAPPPPSAAQPSPAAASACRFASAARSRAIRWRSPRGSAASLVHASFVRSPPRTRTCFKSESSCSRVRSCWVKQVSKYLLPVGLVHYLDTSLLLESALRCSSASSALSSASDATFIGRCGRWSTASEAQPRLHRQRTRRGETRMSSR